MGTTYPTLPNCSAADAFTLAQPGPLYLDLDVSHLPFAKPQSFYLTNAAWSDTVQSVWVSQLNSDFTWFRDVPFTSNLFEVHNLAASPTATRANVTQYLLFWQKKCAKAHTTPFLTTE